jgi:hypothetical protein
MKPRSPTGALEEFTPNKLGDPQSFVSFAVQYGMTGLFRKFGKLNISGFFISGGPCMFIEFVSLISDELNEHEGLFPSPELGFPRRDATGRVTRSSRRSLFKDFPLVSPNQEHEDEDADNPRQSNPQAWPPEQIPVARSHPQSRTTVY